MWTALSDAVVADALRKVLAFLKPLRAIAHDKDRDKHD
jgi:hypothetical protein